MYDISSEALIEAVNSWRHTLALEHLDSCVHLPWHRLVPSTQRCFGDNFSSWGNTSLKIHKVQVKPEARSLGSSMVCVWMAAGSTHSSSTPMETTMLELCSPFSLALSETPLQTLHRETQEFRARPLPLDKTTTM